MPSDLQPEVDAALARLRASGTDLQSIEVKSASKKLPAGTVDTLSAFANASGGLLLLGISEQDGFSAVKIDAPSIASALASACSDQLEPPIRAHIDIVTFQSRPIVACLVDEMEPVQKPCFVKTRGMNQGSFFANT